MNKFFLIPALLFFYVMSLIQAAEEAPKTKLEEFQSQKGFVLIKGHTDIGSVSELLGTISVHAMELTRLGSDLKQSGIVIDVSDSDGREERSFIDYDEIDSLLKGIDIIIKATSNVTKLKNFEAQYCTNGNLDITTYSGENGKVSASVESGYFRSRVAYISLEKLARFRELIVKAKATLDAAQ